MTNSKLLLIAAVLVTAISGCGGDPIITSIGGISTPRPDYFGHSVTTGDVTGDGFPDLVVGAPWGEGGGFFDTGEVLVFPANGAGGLDQALRLAAPSPSWSSQFGYSVAISDISGDGIADVVVGAPYVISFGGIPVMQRVGEVFIFPANGAGGFTAPLSLTDPTPEGVAEFGMSLATGDVTGDGFADVVVGSPGATVGFSGKAGKVLVFPSDGIGGFNPPLTLTAPSPGPRQYFGSSLAIGDLNGDGRTDIVVGAAAPFLPGQVFVFPADGVGGFNTPSTIADPTPESIAAFGKSVAVGDATGDGIPDLVVGVPFATAGGVSFAGEVFVFPGDGLGGFNTPINLTEPTPQMNAQFGYSVTIGEVTGDANPDVIIGAIGLFQTFVFLGDGAGNFNPASPISGSWSHATGDLTGDGTTDLIAGSPQSSQEERDGRVFIYPNGLGVPLKVIP